MPDPTVTVWRNHIPHRCTLFYWGRKWRFLDGRPRRVHHWTVHAGGETLTIRADGWHMFECYHADGQPLEVDGRADVPDD